MDIITLNQNVRNALDFIKTNAQPAFNPDSYKIPFVVGSGNAINTGKILFAKKPAIFCDESNYKQTIEAFSTAIESKLITDAIIISASGEKDSVAEVEFANSVGLSTTLLTCNSNATAAKIAHQVIAYKKIAEPYTYNFSTYAGMIFGTTNENVDNIIQFLETMSFPEDYGKYQSYSFILPDEYGEICPMIEIKRNELFGPHVALRAFTFGHARHAGFVHPWDQELVITIGATNLHFGDQNHRWDIAIPTDFKYASILSIAYFLVGKIQEQKPPYFKEHITAFCNDYGPKAYGKSQVFDVIVPGNS